MNHEACERKTPSTITGYEVITNVVVQSGKAGRIHLHPKWMGNAVKVIRVNGLEE